MNDVQDRWNLIFGLVSSAWSAVIALAVVPFFLRFLGIEAYGLIGFFIALQAIFGILDMGLSATISREVARCRGSGHPEEARDLLHTLATIYWLMGFAIGIFVIVAAGPIADHWLHDTAMPSAEVRGAIRLMGLIIALRWPVALYAGSLIGAGKLTHVSVITILVSTITNVGAVLVLWLIKPTISAFFAWQTLCTLAHVIGICIIGWREIGGRRGAHFDKAGLKRIWRFSAGLSVAAIIGTIFMQSDKVILARIVPLAELGGYVLAGTVARVLYIILTPTFNVIYPRMTAMLASGREDELTAYYRYGTRLLLAAIVPFSAFVAYFAHDLLLLWTGNAATASRVAPLVPFMIAGTVLNGVMHFPYALQLASGRSRLPATINIILLLMFIPMLTYLASHYGIFGGAIAWALLNAGYVLIGTWLTHRQILPGMGLRWLAYDVAFPVCALALITGAGATLASVAATQIIPKLAIGAGFALLAGAFGALFCPPVLTYLRTIARRSASSPNPSTSTSR